MKAKTTKKEINSRFRNVLNIDADEMNSLLYFNPAFAYSTRVEGWACDYYEIGNICLSSGYSPIGKHASRDLQKSFDIKAKKVLQSTFFKTETKQKKINALLLQFAEQAINI
jgi:hypothetical protein